MPAHRVIGLAGELPILRDDLVVSRLAMLIEGQCEGIGAVKAAAKLDLSKQRDFQLLKLYREHGSACQATLILTPLLPVLTLTPIRPSCYRFKTPLSFRFRSSPPPPQEHLWWSVLNYFDLY